MNVLYGETDKVQHSNNEYTDNANWWAKTTGNQAAIQRMNEGADTLEEPEEIPLEDREQTSGCLTRMINWIGTRISNANRKVKMIMKSSIWTALAGLSYWLVGYLGTSKDKLTDCLTKGQLVGIAALLINTASLFFTVFGAMGWLRTDTPQTEVEEETAQHLPDGLLGVGTAATAITADGITIANGTNTAICIPGLLAEIGSAIRSFSNISATCNSEDMVQCKKIKKILKYLADLVASLIGAIAYALSMSGNNDALSMFMCEVIIRGVRLLFSVVNTLYVLCCRHTDQADVPEIPHE